MNHPIIGGDSGSGGQRPGVDNCPRIERLRFASYGRTIYSLSAVAMIARDRQFRAARTLVAAHGGFINAEYFDAGQPPATLWGECRDARSLLKRLRDPARDFDAIVLGGPAQTLSPDYYTHLIQLVQAHGVGVWIPHLNGPIDLNITIHRLALEIILEVKDQRRAHSVVKLLTLKERDTHRAATDGTDREGR